MVHPSRSLTFLLALAWSKCHCQAFLTQRNALVAEFVASRPVNRGNARSFAIFYENPSLTSSNDEQQRQVDSTLQRFQREAAREKAVDEECILTIHGSRYNMTAWANAHPGRKITLPRKESILWKNSLSGRMTTAHDFIISSWDACCALLSFLSLLCIHGRPTGGAKILQKFHNRDASKGFEAAHHSADAYAMLKDFLVEEQINANTETSTTENVIHPTTTTFRRRLSRVRHKLFTREDPIGIHKYLGLFCLVNFIGRFGQMLFGEPAAGLGTRGHPWFAIACLIPHGMLSLSSLIFDTVPRERVVGKPMIWQEYRVHNILFGLRSVSAALATALTIRFGNGPRVRFAATLFCGACILAANYGADMATEKLRAVEVESTTATMPYWEGCSIETQLRFKSFYAYCQFMATLACLVCVMTDGSSFGIGCPSMTHSLSFLSMSQLGCRKSCMGPGGPFGDPDGQLAHDTGEKRPTERSGISLRIHHESHIALVCWFAFRLPYQNS